MTSQPQLTLPDDYVYVDDSDALARITANVSAASALAVDTEADGMHSFFEKVCLVQLATDDGDAFVLDPLALDGLDELASVMADPEVPKIFHGADFDVVGLKRDFGYEFRNLFDTMVASMLLGDEKLSLLHLVERFFGVTLAKAYTRCDWGRRPLSEEQLAYSYHDVAFLVPLMDIQRERLEQADLVEEAEIEFERLCGREPAPREFDPHGFWRIKGIKTLQPAELAIVHELFALRDQHARRLDRPVFKVIGNETMLRLAKQPPRHIGELRRVKGVSSYVAGRMGKDIVAAVARGVESGAPPPRPRPPPDPTRRLGMSGQKRLGRLRDWRNEKSAETKITTMAILPNYAMFEVARQRPATCDELAAIEGVGPKRADRWGEDMLALVG
jgi:ribonuclease D